MLMIRQKDVSPETDAIIANLDVTLGFEFIGIENKKQVKNH